MRFVTLYAAEAAASVRMSFADKANFALQVGGNRGEPVQLCLQGRTGLIQRAARRVEFGLRRRGRALLDP